MSEKSKRTNFLERIVSLSFLVFMFVIVFAADKISYAAPAREDSTNDPSRTPSATEIEIPSATPTATATSTFTITASPTGSNTPTTSSTSTPPPLSTSTPSSTASPTPSPTSTPTASATATATPAPAPIVANDASSDSTPTNTLIPARSVVINEIAWAGTAASYNDEWIELYNPGASPINLDGWTLEADDGRPRIELSDTIPAGGFFLLERTDDTTVGDILADLIYTGTLSNSGERLQLLAPSGETVDTANTDGGGWPAGDSDDRASMERIDPSEADSDSNWSTNDGITKNGHDANGDPLNGTPGQVNSTPSTPATNTPTPTNTHTPTLTNTSTDIPPLAVVINEIAWAGTAASSYDEWIELYNPGSSPIDLTGWLLNADDGSPSIALSGSISAGDYFLLERTDDETVSDLPADLIYTGTLSNSGEQLVLEDAAGNIIDTSNNDGGGWPAGTSSSGTPVYASMERIDSSAEDTDANWSTNNGITRNGHDSKGNAINGTPGQVNSALSTSATNTPTPTNTSTFTPTATTTSTSTPTPTSTSTHTSTPTPTSSSTPTPVPARTIIINEIAWSGTEASSYDEWIELYNPGASPINLNGWTLEADDGRPRIELSGTIPEWGFFLLERTDETTVYDISADQIYTGTLENGGEMLRLIGPCGETVDTANLDGGEWPAGDSDGRVSMERNANAPDTSSVWESNNGLIVSGLDVDGSPINGSPKQVNSVVLYPSTATPTPTHTATTAPQYTIRINEVAWAGTIGSYYDEWIELYNASPVTIPLAGWQLVSADGKPDIALDGKIPGHSFFLLERTNDTTVANIAADQIYSGSLSNSGENLYLRDPSGSIVDEVRQINGEWPAGDAYLRKTMERRSRTRWGTNTGYRTNGLDVDGYRIRGTPKQANSVWYPTPTPTALPTGTQILINEFLPHPKYDWNGDGKPTSSDEFIELINAGTVSVNLIDWILDDEEEGSSPYLLPDLEILPGETLAFFRSETGLSLSDGGDSVRLFLPDQTPVDERSYNFAKSVNLSWCRSPDGIAELVFPCWPTPGRGNAAYPLATPNAPDPVQPPQPPAQPPAPKQQPPILSPGWELPNGVIGYL